MSPDDDFSIDINAEEEDVVVYVPKNKAQKAEYIDDEGVRVVNDVSAVRTSNRGNTEEHSTAAPEPTRRMSAVRDEAEREAARRLNTVKPETLSEPTRRMRASEQKEEAQPVARRVRGKTTAGKGRKRGISRRLSLSPRAVIAGAAALAVLAAVIVIVVSAGGGKQNLPEAVVLGFLDDNGKACVPLYNGKAVTVGQEAAGCALTADRRNMVIRMQNGSIYRYEIAKDIMTEICGPTGRRGGVSALRNTGVLYTDDNGLLHRYEFSSGKDTEIGRTESYAAAKNTLSVLYSSGERFFILKEGEDKATEAGSYSGTPRAVAVADRGECAVWSDWSNNAQNIYLFDSRGRSTLETLVGTTAVTNAVFSENGKLIAITNPDSESVYIWNKGSLSRAKLGGLPVDDRILTATGPLGQDGGGDVSGIYMHISGSAGGSVYYVDLMGEREKLVSKVQSFQLRGGTCCFIASDGNMYYAAVNGANASERVRISSDVYSYTLAENGKYVYYVKDVSAGLGTLYVYRIGDEEPEKIASEVDMAYVSCENSKSVIYYRDAESVDGRKRIGTMYLYTDGEGAEKIANDAVVGRVSSGSESGRIDAKSFMYLRYLSSDSSGRLYSNCVYYDGKQSTAVLKDVYYDDDTTWKLK